MSFLFRLLTVVELVLWLKRFKEASNADVAQAGERDDDRVHDRDRPSRSSVLDDIQTKSFRHPSDNQSTQRGQDPHQEGNP